MAHSFTVLQNLHIDRRRSAVLMALGVITAVLLVCAGAAARMYRQQETRLARMWFDQGQQALARGDAGNAVEDFHTALAYAPSDDYRLRLAQALIAAGRRDEARAHLLTLVESEPGSGTVNLELARLAAARGDYRQASRYYHNALYGVWQEDPQQARRNLRLEAAKFFLKHSDTSAAEAELIPLAALLPRDAAQHADVAELFRRAGDGSRALAEFRTALEIDPNYLPALRGAGEIAFDAGDYAAARRYLERALHGDPSDTDVQHRLQTADLVLRMNPFEVRLSAAERARRAAQAFAAAQARLEACAGAKGIDLASADAPSDLAQLYRQTRDLGSVNERALRRDPDRILPLIDWAMAAEDAATRACGPPSDVDLAIVLAGRQARR